MRNQLKTIQFLKNINEQLTVENEKLKSDMSEITKNCGVRSLVTDFMIKNSFVDYVNFLSI